MKHISPDTFAKPLEEEEEIHYFHTASKGLRTWWISSSSYEDEPVMMSGPHGP